MTKSLIDGKTANFSGYGRRDDFTPHAQVRFQQRGLSQTCIDVVLEFGKRRLRKRSGKRKTAYVYFMDKRGRRNAARAMGKDYKRISNKIDIYIVESFDTGEIITVAHRKQRLKW